MLFQVFKTCRISMEGAYGDAGFIPWMYALKVIIWVGVSRCTNAAGDNNNNDDDRNEDDDAVECHSGTCVGDGCCKSTQNIVPAHFLAASSTAPTNLIWDTVASNRQVICYIIGQRSSSKK